MRSHRSGRELRLSPILVGAVCEAAPATCGRQPDCACLEGQELDNGLQLDFCLQEGSCESEDGLVAIVCPGG